MKLLLRCARIPMLLLLLVIFPGITYASLLCRADPKVELSNGIKLNLGVSIAANQQDVTQVIYELHVPVGVSLRKTVKTSGWASSIETFTYVADQQPGQYYVTTTVHTRLGDAVVSAYTTVKSDGKTTYTVSGLEGQPLTASFGS